MNVNVYSVTIYGDDKERIVHGNIEHQKVACACRKFETHGILCSHALKVLDVMNIKLIPQQYILKRWTRDARLRSDGDCKGKPIELDVKANFMKRCNELCPRMVKLTNKASESHETWSFLYKVYEESNKIIDDMLTKKSKDGEPIEMCQVSILIVKEQIENTVKPIDLGGAKGIKKRDCTYKRRKRLKTWVEKLARKSKAKPSPKKKQTNKKKLTD